MSERPSSGAHPGFAALHAARVEPGERIREAAAHAPIWVIAIMAHLALAAVLGMVYVRHDVQRKERDRTVIVTQAGEEPAKLGDALIVEIPRDRMPVAAVPDGLRDDSLMAPRGCDQPVLPFGDGGEVSAEASGRGGEPTESGGGVGLPGAMGLGAGSGPGGGAARSTLPIGTNARIQRLFQSSHLKSSQPIVKGGLRWLREHQSEEGLWDCDGFHLRCDPKLGHECGGRGNPGFDVGVTGLALLAFLGAGHDGGGRNPNDEAVKRGLRWLRSCQDAEGCFGPRTDRFTYSHACATIAMCEATMLTRLPAWRKSAQAAIDFVRASQAPSKGWRYEVRPRDCDASVTGWMMLALKAGKDAGLDVDDRCIRDGLAFLDTLTDESGRTGYLRRGELPVRPEGMVDRWPALESESLTAVALCARVFLGHEEQNHAIAMGRSILLRKPPVWDEARGSIDMYYWYYGTLVMHQLGGPSWEQWNKSLEKAVIESQVKTGCTEGSWDPKDPWGEAGGRVYSTALMTLCFEVYWRYPLVFGAGK